MNEWRLKKTYALVHCIGIVLSGEPGVLFSLHLDHVHNSLHPSLHSRGFVLAGPLTSHQDNPGPLPKVSNAQSNDIIISIK